MPNVAATRALRPHGRNPPPRKPGTNVGALCKELGITRQTLYRHVSPTGELREDGRKLLAKDRSKVAR